MMNKFDGWPHIIESQQFTRHWLENDFFPLAQEMENVANDSVFSGKTMFSLFYQPSTRTRFSFEMAMLKLGGDVISTENARDFSSAVKGETLQDTIEVLNQYGPDVIVLRHHKKGGARTAALVSKAPVINAGDGPGQHPTQALLDIYTIQRIFGAVNNISIAMAGDLLHGRTVRSLSYLLAKFSGIRIYFVSPEDSRMGEDVKEYLDKTKTWYKEEGNLRTVAPLINVIYQTRTQDEYGPVSDRPDQLIVDKTILDLIKEDAIIMHPLPIARDRPHGGEITPEVDGDYRAVYKREQVRNGLYTRMALLKMVLS